jgi:hypothetical protein
MLDVPLIAVALSASIAACGEPDGSPTLPSEPQLMQGPSSGCDLRDAVRAARSYFPGQGQNSIRSQALAHLSAMADACQASNSDGYAGGFFAVSALIEQVLENTTAGAPSDGDALLWGMLSTSGPSGSPIFNPCGGDQDCETWDMTEFPTRPGFVPALSAGGTFAVVSTGTAAVCAGHRSPCANIDPAPSVHGETWGVEPSATWQAALHGRVSLLFGGPLVQASPTGEVIYSPAATGYSFNLIPHPTQFQPGAAVLEVGLCSTAVAGIGQAVIQKGNTVLEQAVLGFCPGQTAAATPGSVWGQLAAVVGRLLDPRPKALVATAFRTGPGGGAGSWSDFWAIDIPAAATFLYVNPPVDGTAGQPIPGADGSPVKIRAITTSQQSPIENVLVTVTFQKNNGFLQAGDVQSGTLTCDTQTGSCTGNTQADQDPQPGELELPITLTKTGAYRMCVTGQLAPLVFDTVCTALFNIRPAN